MPKLPKTAGRSRYVTSTLSGERVEAFVPAPLPPDTRTLDLASLQGELSLDGSGAALGRVAGPGRRALRKIVQAHSILNDRCFRRHTDYYLVTYLVT